MSTTNGVVTKFVSVVRRFTKSLDALDRSGAAHGPEAEALETARNMAVGEGCPSVGNRPLK